MGEEHENGNQDEGRPTGGDAAASENAPGEPEAESDDEESLRRLDEWLTKEHDQIANEWERVNEAAKPLGKIEVDPDQAIDAASMSELGRASQLEPVQIDSRIEGMDDEDNMPESEYGVLAETKVRIVGEKIAERETQSMLNGGWIAVQRDQFEAVAETISRTGISSVQAIATAMMLVGKRIGECRMRDLMETMSQTTEVQAGSK